MRGGLSYRITKRTLDFTGALLLLILFGPLLLVLWVLVRRSLGRPAFFRQERAGRGGRPFILAKFRSMTDARTEDGKLLPDPQRITALGRFLRRSSLDELPQLWNVLKGDMSFVGPRPLYVAYIPLYTPTQATRLEVKPGITGLAQISGRNALDWSSKLALDAAYVRQASLRADLVILLRTVQKVLRSEGIPATGLGNLRFQGAPDVDPPPYPRL